MSDDVRFVEVHRTFDPIQAEILADILAGNGIDVRALGTRNGALIGVGQGILEQRIEVPMSKEAEARGLIEAFLRERPAPAPTEPGTPASERRRRSPVLAAGAVLVIFGGGHFYARRNWSGLVLALTVLAAIVTVVSVDLPWRALLAVGDVVVGALLIDLVGAQLAVRAYNRGRDVSRARQIATTLGALLVVGAVSVLLSSRIEEPGAVAVEPPLDDLRLPYDPGPPDDDLAEFLRVFPVVGPSRGDPVPRAEQPLAAPSIHDRQAAEALAAAIVADIRLYDEADVAAVAAGRAVSPALRAEIDEGRVLYLQRTSPEIVGREAIWEAAVAPLLRPGPP